MSKQSLEIEQIRIELTDKGVACAGIIYDEIIRLRRLEINLSLEIAVLRDALKLMENKLIYCGQAIAGKNVPERYNSPQAESAVELRDRAIKLEDWYDSIMTKTP